MKKIVALVLYFLVFLQAIFATNLAQISLEEASYEELVMMCELRGITEHTSREQMIASLKQQFEIDYPINNAEDINTINSEEQIKDKLSFNINNSNSLKMIRENDTTFIILEGDISLSFNESSNDKKELKAQKIIIDVTNNKLAAFGSVEFINSESESNLLSQAIGGEIVTYNWQSNKFLVSNANISTQRKNSDNETVVFSATSSLMSLDTINNTLVLNGGFITTNPDTAYSSISASKFALLNHGDMYLENAKLSIGRINVLYLPFFFSPGAKMVGNPAIGYEYSRGAFVNTTFEIIGKYPKFAQVSTSSFNSFLKNDNSSDLYANGAIYNSSEPKNDLDKWASDTKSYFALFLDAYENTPYSIDTDKKGSVVIGYDFQFNLINKALTIESSAITSFASDGMIGDITKYSDYPMFRYDISFNTKLNLKNGNFSFSFPIISDPKVRKTYGNRLSTFTIDSLWKSNQSFPTNYSSDITKYSWFLDANYSLKPESLSPYISQINLSSLEAQVDYKWEAVNNNYLYNVDKITFPSVDFSMNGTLINFSQKPKKVDLEKTEEDPTEDKDINTDSQDLLNLLYKSSYKEDSVLNTKTSALNVLYNLDNDFYYSEDLSDEEKDLYNKTTLNFKTSANIEPNIIKIDNNTNLKYLIRDNYDDESKYSFNVITSNIINLPFINLYYYFDSIIYENIKEESNGTTTNEISQFEFSDDFISKHEIEWKDTYNLFDVKVTPSLKLVLPPLSWAFKPSLLINYNNLSNKTIFTFDVDSNNFDLTDINDNFSYSVGKFNMNFNLSYDVANSLTSTRFLDSLVLSTNFVYNDKENNQMLSHSSKYYGLYDGTVENYFSKFNFTYKNSFLNSKINFFTDDNILQLDYFKNTISFSDFEKYWWENRIGLKLDIDATFNYSFVDKYSTYFSLSTNLKFRIAEFMLVNLSIKTSNYGFYTYYDNNDKFSFSEMFIDLLKSFDFINGGRSDTQFNLEEISLDFVHMMDDWDLHCKYKGSVVLSNYNYQWVPSVSLFLQWKTLPELNVDQSFTDNGDGWE